MPRTEATREDIRQLGIREVGEAKLTCQRTCTADVIRNALFPKVSHRQDTLSQPETLFSKKQKNKNVASPQQS